MAVTTTLRRAATALVFCLISGAAVAQGGPAGPPAVGTTTVRPTAITETNEFVGRIQAINRVNLVARVTGFLTKRLFVEGSEVKQGDLLYQIEKPPFEADVQAKTAAVAQAQATLQNASITLNRAQTLLSTPAGQRSTYDDAVAAQRGDAALLLAAQANLQNSQINLGYTDITAPVAGKISRTQVTVGNVVSPSSGTLATIVSQDPMYVYFPIATRTALELRDRYADKGGTAAVVIKLRLPDGRMYGVDGHIDYIDPFVSQTTDTISIRGILPNPLLPGAKAGTPGDRELTDGEFVTVLLQGAQPVQTLAIPQSAVLADQGGQYVFVLGDGNKAEQRRIATGPTSGNMVTVTTGLKDGETIISDGIQRVRNGQTVNPAPAQPGPGGAAGPPGGVPGSGSGSAPQQATTQGSTGGGAGQH